MTATQPTGPAGADSTSDDEKRQILRRRAVALARRPEEEVEEERLELVAFEVAGERYALETRFVREAVRRPQVARLPGAEPPVLGIATWRGELLTVFDARQLLSIPATSAEVKDPVLLVLGEGERVGGTLVERIEGIVTLSPTQLDEPTRGASRGGLIRAMGPDGLALIDGGRTIQSLS